MSIITEYSNNWFKVVQEGKYHYVIEKSPRNASAVLLLEDNENFILVKHYRIAVKSYLIEIPRGYGEKNEDSYQSAIREVYEETGYKINDLIKLGSIAPNSGILSTVVDIYFSNVSSSDKIKDIDHKEIDKIVKIHKNNIEKEILNYNIIDSFTLSAIYLFKTRVLWKMMASLELEGINENIRNPPSQR